MLRHNLVILLLAGVMLMTGCWDGRELEKRSLVLLVGVEREENQYRVYLQLARPQSLGGGGGEGKGDGDPALVISRSGEDLPEIVQKLQLSVDRELFFAHVRGVVLSESVAQDGILGILNVLKNELRVPRTAWIFVVKGGVRPVLTARPELDRIPSTYLSNFFENLTLFQRPHDVSLGSFYNMAVTPGIHPVAMWIGERQPDQSAPSILGVAAFQGDRFQGGLTAEQMIGWTLLKGQPLPGRIYVPCPGGKGQFAVRITTVRRRIYPQVGDGEVRGVLVQLWVAGRTAAVTCQTQDALPATSEALTRAFEERVERAASLAISASQSDVRTDVLGIGRMVYRHAFRHWPGEERWDELYPTLPVRLQTESVLDLSVNVTTSP